MNVFKKLISKVYWSAPVISIYALLCLAFLVIESSIFSEKDRLTWHCWFNSPMIFVPSNIDQPVWILWLQLSAPKYIDLGEVRTYVKLWTHILGHGSWSHFSVNAAYLMLIGPLVERHYGSLRVLGLILVTAITTSTVSLFVTGDPIIGASGVIFFLIILNLFITNHDESERRVPIESVVVSLFFICREIVNMFGVNNVSQLTHLVGAAIGIVYVYRLRQKNPEEKDVVR
ncbi:rhomboid family intramembrane serine protease [Patescibacteria group bacterium]